MRRALPYLPLLLALMALPFALHSLGRPFDALAGDPEARGRLFGDALSNLAIFGHMALGGILTVGVPLQLLPMLRTRLPGLHRRAGYALAVAAALTALGGLVYIALNGTVGGAWMSVWFALYGVAMLIAAAQTVYCAIDKDFARHRRWALRLTVLAVGSFLYRVHYGVWFALTGGLGAQEDFTGPFDRIQVFAFYLPYLILLEMYFRRVPRLAKGHPA